MKSYTQAQVYQLIYAIIKNERIHLGADKASRLANKYAVKATWIVYNNPAEYIKFVNKFIALCTPSPTRDLT